ncbi:uncharacterized protein CIMG_07112 [Coccidioides immitis RS]|uniref:Dynein light chain n=4 Tax=Coccidioides immitis TaxID=5501 RepID=J3K9N2_COCIM|nr:uncharacterized protein CIMG_07112 [Coccidioides immitis RS]EAS31633.3 hypothetical protein CIMG_07112 [Coccidioides immitis RS]KMP04289.1 hypothetical protein CIRG_03980 [Coccidioides immitis RMSCC 2394]KMU73420.1 hypothetical protein CISG_03555 [Coccidioides immitis RMSCC 3703]KMU87107.1 hypothetical protein CIHG_05047 [Coccidioides immitis H538.4]
MTTEATPNNPPVPIEELSRIAAEACDATLEGVSSYDHEKVGQWSSQIINKILQSLISATTSTGSTSSPSPSESKQPSYRFTVNCTVIQQGLTDAQSSDSNPGANSVEVAGRRGMHSASGAYWDIKRDGMWTYKYPNGIEKGLDLVLNVVWFGSF